MMNYFDLSKYTEYENLLGSQNCEQVFEGILNALNILPVGGILLIDFRSISDITYDCLIKIAHAISMQWQQEFQDKYIILKITSANVSLKDSFNTIFKEKGIVAPSLDEKENWEVLGSLTKAQKDTLEVIKEKREASSRDLTEILNIPISAASNRLKDLYDMKLVTREERILSTGGRQFIYHLCHPVG